MRSPNAPMRSSTERTRLMSNGLPASLALYRLATQAAHSLASCAASIEARQGTFGAPPSGAAKAKYRARTARWCGCMVQASANSSRPFL
jgi:hypothetical protein